MNIRHYSANEIINLKSQKIDLAAAAEVDFYLRTPGAKKGGYIQQLYDMTLSQLINKAGFDISTYPAGVQNAEDERLKLLAERLSVHFLKRKLDRIKQPEHLAFKAGSELLDPHHHLNSIYVKDNPHLLNLLPDFGAIYVALRPGPSAILPGTSPILDNRREAELRAQKDILTDAQFLGRAPDTLINKLTQKVKLNETVGYVRGKAKDHFKEGFITQQAKKHNDTCRCCDMCGPETKDSFKDLERYINHTIRHKAEIIRVHIGETHIPSHGKENVRQLFKLLDSKKTELAGKQIRLGHGTHMGIDSMKECTQKGYYVEACLSSNKETGIITKRKEYPLGLMLLLDVKVMLGTDGGDVYYTDLKTEYGHAKKVLKSFLDKMDKGSNDSIQVPNGDKLKYALVKDLFKNVPVAKSWADNKEITYKDLKLIEKTCHEKINMTKLVDNMNEFKEKMFPGMSKKAILENDKPLQPATVPSPTTVSSTTAPVVAKTNFSHAPPVKSQKKTLTPLPRSAINKNKTNQMTSPNTGHAAGNFEVTLSEETLVKIQKYKAALAIKSELPGKDLGKILEGKDISKLSDEAFIQALMYAKHTCYFAENINLNNSPWNKTELAILGDIGVSAQVKIYDDGQWKAKDAKPHQKELDGTLLFMPGALLATENSDKDEVFAGRKFNFDAFERLYERRLLPLLLDANNKSTPTEKAFITMPGVGSGVFAGDFMGPNTANFIKEQYQRVIEKILTDHGAKLTNIAGIYYDPFNGCKDTTQNINGIQLLTKPSAILKSEAKSQLCPCSDYGQQFKDCKLFSVVAWDHVSWPGNDFYKKNDRNTDDGVKGAATNIISVLTGIEGKYNKEEKKFLPPEPYPDWNAVIRAKNVNFDIAGKIAVYSSAGDKKYLTGSKLEVNKLVNASALSLGLEVPKISPGVAIPHWFSKFICKNEKLHPSNLPKLDANLLNQPYGKFGSPLLIMTLVSLKDALISNPKRSEAAANLSAFAAQIISTTTNLNLQDINGVSALQKAIWYGCTLDDQKDRLVFQSLAKELLNKGADLNLADKHGRNVFFDLKDGERLKKEDKDFAFDCGWIKKIIKPEDKAQTKEMQNKDTSKVKPRKRVVADKNDNEVFVSTGDGTVSRSNILNKSQICHRPPIDEWHYTHNNNHLLVLGKGKTVEEAKQTLLGEISKPLAGQATGKPLTNLQLASLDVYKKGEIRVIKYTASELTNDAKMNDFVAGNNFSQCGAVITCINPGKKMGLDLVLPPEVKIKNSTLTEQNSNFNALIFDHIHKAVQEVLLALKNNGGKGKPIFNLNKVTDPKNHQFEPKELAMIQYCHFMGYSCLGKDKQKLGVEILQDHKMDTEKSSDFYLAFKEFTKDTKTEKQEKKMEAGQDEVEAQEATESKFNMH